MPPPVVCIDVKACAYAFIARYSAPKTKRLRTHLEASILFIYPEDARDAEQGLRRVDREEHRQRFRTRIYLDFEGDGYILRHNRRCWELYAGNNPPPDEDDSDDTTFGDDGDGGGFDALQETFEGGGDTVTAIMLTLDEIISRKEMSELCDPRLRPAARSDEQQQPRRVFAVKSIQGFISRATKLWAKLKSRSRTLYQLNRPPKPHLIRHGRLGYSKLLSQLT